MTPGRSRRIAYRVARDYGLSPAEARRMVETLWQPEHARSRSEAEVRYQAWACVMWWRGTGAKSPRGIAGF